MMRRSDTDHSFYLLAGQIVNDGGADVLQRRARGQQTVHGHLGGRPNVGRLLVVQRPLGDVQQPLR